MHETEHKRRNHRKRSRLMWTGFLCIVAIVCLIPRPASGQTAGTQVLSTIFGNVKDPSGAVVPKAEVVVTNEATNLSQHLRSDSAGGFLLPNITPGDYRVEVTFTGFKKFSAEHIHVAPHQVVSVDAKLEVGLTTQVVEVTGAASLLNTFSNQLSTTIDSRRVSELPLNGRDITALAMLAVGTVRPDGGTSWYAGSMGFTATTVSSNGQRSQQNSYLLDGVSNEFKVRGVGNPMPNPDAVQEFNYLTGQYSAEFGKAPGGVLTASTKSGGNTLHGDVFEYYRDHNWNARNFFSHNDDGLKRHQYGYAVGGPVYIPKVYDGRNRFFWFSSAQWTPVRSSPSTNPVFGPTTAEANGDYSAYLTGQIKQVVPSPLCDGSMITVDTGALFDPKTVNPACANQGYPFDPAYPSTGATAKNVIPTGRIHPFATALSHHVALLSNKDTPIYITKPNKRDEWQWVNRFDYNLSQNHRISVRLFNAKASTPSYFNVNDLYASVFGSISPFRNYAGTETWSISPTLVNTFSVGHTMNGGASIPSNFVNGKPWGYTDLFQEAGITAPFQELGPERQVAMNILNMGGIESNVTSLTQFRSYEVHDTLRWVRGRNELSLGAGGYAHRLVPVVNSIGQFRYQFLDNYTGIARGFADMQLDSNTFPTVSAVFFAQQLQSKVRGVRNAPYVFLQDNVRVNPRFTLNLGLRWEPYLGPYNDSVKWGAVTYGDQNWFPSPAGSGTGPQSTVYYNAPRGVLFPGDARMPTKSDVFDRWRVFSPRVGFAIDPFGNGKWSVRGGVGDFRGSYVNQWPQSGFGQPAAATGGFYVLPGTIDNPFAKYFGGRDPRPFPEFPSRSAAFIPPLTGWVNDAQLKAPGVYQWSLTIEHEVIQNGVLRVGYVGSHGYDLISSRILNYPAYIPGASTEQNAQSRRPFNADGMGEVRFTESSSNSSYHALQIEFEKRYSQGFSLLTNYSWSKSIDQESTEIGWVGFSQSDPRGPGFNRGPSDFNQSHAFKTAFIWDLPTGRLGANPVAKKILGGWELTGNVQYYTGFPDGVRDGYSTFLINSPYFGNSRADCVGGSITLDVSRSRNQLVNGYLNRAAVSAHPLDGNNGTCGRNNFLDPGSFFNDFGIFKNIGVYKENKIKLQFRAEFFNAINWVNLGAPNHNVNSGGFGKITGAGDPRQIQLGLKVDF